MSETERDRVGAEPVEPRHQDLEALDGSMDPDSMSPEEIAVAEASRPSLPGETGDGLDDLDEEVRHQAEDLPDDTGGRR